MDNIKAKQQIVEKIKESTNILVTVSDNPTVDALSAAIGLTLQLDKLGKYGTAVFSGVVPPAIAFLEPEKILDDTTDSLRDFIIALDKEKADHLRYKIEGDSVKIFITPYKTTITSDDLVFSQGDYNVQLVIALGVDNQDHLDKALESHGQILHDATVVTVTAGEQTSTLGGIDWHDDQASSLSEMLSGIADLLKTDKVKSVMDKQVATAYLTGIVAETERFSNRNTSAKVMTVAAQLMAAGADQQLIAGKLEEAQSIPDVEEPIVEESEPEPAQESAIDADGTLRITDHEKKEEEETPVEPESESEPEPEIVVEQEQEPEIESEPTENVEITHNEFESLEEMDKRVKAAEQEEAAEAAVEALDEITEAPAEPIFEPTPEQQPVNELSPAESLVSSVVTQNDEAEEPTLGGTLSATAEQAADDSRREEESDQNKTILTHGAPSEPSQPFAPDFPPLPSFSTPIPEPPVTSFEAPAYTEPQPEFPQPPVNPTPADLGLPMPPPLPDFSVPPSLAGPYAPEVPTVPAQPERLGDIFAPDPSAYAPVAPVPPVPDATAYAAPTAPVLEGPYAPPPADNPGQFKIPGQQ